MSVLVLKSCTPEPLMGFLKALGVLRLVSEDRQHGDPGARMSWVGGVCELESRLGREGLLSFLLDRYRPTPVLAPWNGGSGFYGGGSEPLEAIAKSTTDRLALYRQTIVEVRKLIPKEKPKDEQKQSVLMRCRAELPDEVVPWLDTCFVLGEEGPSYFPLLGTGGNDGRLDFTNNFFQRLKEVIPFGDEEPPPMSAGWLSAALFGDSLAPLGRAAVGQFNPGGIGGANGTQGKFEADSRVNPWDYVLMVEGAMLFAGSVARRLGTGTAQRAVFPFTVESVAVGYGSATASEETTDGSRAELWLPLWDRPATLAEVAHLFAEGRAQFGKRQARNAVEFALAVSLLGVSRGITAFARYGFLKRNGLAFLAAPLGRVTVTPRPAAQLLQDAKLNEWLERLRAACRDKEKTPARYQAALRQIDRALFGFATRSETGEASDRRALVDVLRAVGRAERTLANGLRFCADKYIRPLQGLIPQWLAQATDGSPEFRLAAAVAGIRQVKGTAVGPFRVFLEPVTLRGDGVSWDSGSTSAVWSNRPLEANLGAVFLRRQLECFRSGLSGVPLNSSRPARLDDVIAFLRGETDDEKLTDLLWALPAVAWSEVEQQEPERAATEDLVVPAEFGLPRLLVNPLTFTASRERWVTAAESTDHATIPDPDVFSAIAAGRVGVTDRAADRLLAGGLVPFGHRNRTSSKPYRHDSPAAVAGQSSRVLAAMLFPLPKHDLEAIANSVLYPPEVQE